MSEPTDRLSKEDLERILQEKILPKARLSELTTHETPKAIVLAGQPGSGKSALVRAVREEFQGDVLVIDPDEQRERIPGVRRLQEADPFGWPEKTNTDAFKLANGLRDEGIKQHVNLLIDGSMSDAGNSIRTIEALQKKGYEVEVRAISSHWLESELGIDQRFMRQIDADGVARDVDMDFHNRVYNGLPGNMEKVAEARGVQVRIYDRELNELYDNRRDVGSPNEVLRETRAGRMEDPEVRQQLQEGWKRQQTWHEAMPETIRARQDISPATAEALIARSAVQGKLERATARAEGITAIEAPAQTAEPLLPRLDRAGTTAGLAGIAIAAAAYDAKETGERISTAYAQDNPVAVRSEATHYVARGAGGAVAMFTPAAVGVSGGPALALVVADGYLLTEAFDRGAQYLDARKITHQTDRDGVGWEFNGRQWLRDDLKADLRDDGVNQLHRQEFSAQPDKARELSYLASIEAVSQAMGKAHSQDPFVQPSNDNDLAHLYHRDWTRSAQTGQWSRTVADEVDRNDAPLWKPEPEYALPARAAELDRQAAQVIDRNLSEGPAAMAARYEIDHSRNGWDSLGPEPEAVRTALNPNTLQASDGHQYVRDVQGQWSHDSEIARGNTALELEATRERLVPALAQHQAYLAEIPAWQPPTPEQQDRANLRQLYASHGVSPAPERFEAVYQAVQNTRAVEGVDPATSSLALEPRPAGGFDINTPIQHLRIESDGAVRVAATTTADDIQRTETALKTAPHSIGAPSAQERDGQAQVQREANRIGLSQDETQAAVRVAAPAMSASGGRNRKADSENQELLNEAPTKRNGQDGQPTTTASVPPEFAPSQQGPRDIRDPQHEGNEAYREMQHKVKAFEAQQGIAHGPHSDRMAASMLAFSVEKGLHYSEVSLEKNQDTGQVQLTHAKYGEPAQKFDVDLGKMSSQPIEVSSQRINETVSKHYGAPVPALERTREQAQGLGELSFDDKVMFARIRGGTPGHISDDHVAQAMVAAKKNGIDANSVGQVSMVGDQIRVADAGPAGRTAMVDVNSPAPPLQASVQEANTINQQQVLAQQQTISQQQTQEQGGPSGPTMGARAM